WADAACQGNPNLVGPCFSVRGKLAGYQGYPEWRIWWVGTKRILGVAGHEDPLVPADIRKILDAPEFDFDRSAIYADFLVCPFTRQEPEVMQFVCGELAKNIRVGRRE
ncbi:MAG TPA: hypothetical protein VK598_01255, partial [Nitrospiraceae bacterium]|nr:hypothetical protein [Nitrospiraceae bacterium]